MKLKKVNKIKKTKWIGFNAWAVSKKKINKKLTKQTENQFKEKEIALKDGECQPQDRLRFYKWMIKLFKIKIDKNVKKQFNPNFNTEDDSIW